MPNGKSAADSDAGRDIAEKGYCFFKVFNG
jgi:hypothetical protein